MLLTWPPHKARKTVGSDMSDHEPIDLVIMLKIVEYISARAETAAHYEVDVAQIINVVNYLASGASIGSLFNSERSTRQEISMGDKYVTGQAGAVGPGSLAIGQEYNQIWIQSAGDINLARLAEDLIQVRSAMRASADSVEEDLAVSDLAYAEIAAKEGDGPSVMAHLAKAGRWALEVAEKIGVELAAKAIQKSLGM
jgi:hypothetical protein